MSKVFLDTNLLLYCMDQSDEAKRMRCRDLLRDLESEGSGVISTQVMQEFYVAATRKMSVEPLMAKGVVNSLGRFEVVTVTPQLIGEAIDTSILNQISFWDSLIVACAESARCDSLWTEDLNHGQVIRGVRVVNPLLDAV